METVYKWGKVIVLVTLVLPVVWLTQAGWVLAKLAWLTMKKSFLVVSYVAFFLPTLLFRGRAKRERRHQETLAAIRGDDAGEDTPLVGSPWLLDYTKQAIHEAQAAA